MELDGSDFILRMLFHISPLDIEELIDIENFRQEEILAIFMVLLAKALIRLKFVKFTSEGALLNKLRAVFLFLIASEHSSVHQGTGSLFGFIFTTGIAFCAAVIISFSIFARDRFISVTFNSGDEMTFLYRGQFAFFKFHLAEVLCFKLAGEESLRIIG